MFRAETAYGTVELPCLSLIPRDVLRQLLAADEESRGWLLIELVASPATLDVIDQMPAESLKSLIKRWEAQAGLAVEDLLGLYVNVRKHGDAIAADLLDKGLRLRHCPSQDFSWYDLKVLLRYSPVTSNFYGSLYPDRAGWTREAMLLADAVDALVWLQWAKTKDGRNNRNRPKPIPRPGVTPPAREGSNPKAAPLSVIKDRFKDRYSTRSNDKAAKLKDLFGR